MLDRHRPVCSDGSTVPDAAGLRIDADAVVQGGGVKGIALAGALLGFAHHPQLSVKKWVNVAGTSAGSIIAAFLATGHGPEDLERLIKSAPYEKFQDFGPGGELIGGAINLARHHGLAHGQYFHDWFDEQIDGKTFESVRRDDAEAGSTDNEAYRLRMIAADVTRRELLVLPGDLRSYRSPHSGEPIDPDGFKIADAVRMSMSIPFFFQPISLVHHESGQESTIVDGGLLSNFPVWLFDVKDRRPARPTFGLRLFGGHAGKAINPVAEAFGWPLRFGSDLFHTAMDAWDIRFMSHSTTVRTCPVPADDVGTTDFDISDEKKQELVDGGREAATKFLDEFDLAEYRNTFGHPLDQ
jgi:NTE family protein